MKCIWCHKQSEKAPPEHIIPEALGCPEGFVLSDGAVCKHCNNGLAHLDQAVIDEFDFPAFWAGVPRKKGRPPSIKGRGNVRGTIGPHGKEISVNMEPYPVRAHDGSILGAFGRSERNIKGSTGQDGLMGTCSLDWEFGRSRKFVRGITKIAFSSLAYFEGPRRVLSDRFDPIRAFVRKGRGKRIVFLTSYADRKYRNRAYAPWRSESGDYVVPIRIGKVEFCVDMSPDQVAVPLIKKEARRLYGEIGWGFLPIDG